jgi:hypothetical protein
MNIFILSTVPSVDLPKDAKPHVTAVDVEPNPAADQLEAVLSAADATAAAG